MVHPRWWRHPRAEKIDTIPPRRKPVDLRSAITAYRKARPVEPGHVCLDPDLEPVQTRSQNFAEASIGIEHEGVGGGAPHSQQHLDLARGLQHEAPHRLANLQRPQVL